MRNTGTTGCAPRNRGIPPPHRHGLYLCLTLSHGRRNRCNETNRGDMSTKNVLVGKRGETRARRYYQEKGYTFVAANVRYTCGEIDLIMQQGDTTVFVEVKTRTTGVIGGAEAVTPTKLRRVHRAAMRWLEGKAYRPIRFDVVEIIGGTVTCFKGVDRGAC